MSNIDDPDKIPTQPAMPAVRPPPTVEERIASVEKDYVTRADLQAFTDRQAAYEKACEDDRRTLRNDVTQLTASVGRVESKTDKLDVKVSSVDAKTDAQTRILDRLDKLMSGAMADPKVKLLAQLIIGAAIAYFASKGHLPQ